MTEAAVIDGRTGCSELREQGQSALQDGKPVSTSIGGHSLVGGTMPDAGP
jgi:hypothetical protein